MYLCSFVSMCCVVLYCTVHGYSSDNHRYDANISTCMYLDICKNMCVYIIIYIYISVWVFGGDDDDDGGIDDELL